MNELRLFVALFAGGTLCGCAAQPADDIPPAVSIMTFNVQNLFDTTHDTGKEDFTYLPAAAKQTDEHRAYCATIPVPKWRSECEEFDWSEPTLTIKLERLAKAIMANPPGGADVIALQEVENLAVLERLRREHLGGAGYRKAVLVEGDDARGIDVAFLSRLPVRGEPQLHAPEFQRIDPAGRKDVRGILEATFVLPDGVLLTGFAVHFPAPFHPADLRVQAYQHLNALAAALPEGQVYFAAGDFNTISGEANIIARHAAPQWIVAHELGCEECRGTYYYPPNDNWSFLDMILLSKNLGPGASPWGLEPARTRIGNALAAQVGPGGAPAGFDLPDMAGVSDHWPLLVELRRTASGNEL